jgi:hypothetical protein
MNFTEFKTNVNAMEHKLQEENINPEDVRIEYTRFDGYDCLWAVHGDKIISYFKW